MLNKYNFHEILRFSLCHFFLILFCFILLLCPHLRLYRFCERKVSFIMSGYSGANPGWGGNYGGFNYQNNQPNYGFSYQNNRGNAPNYGFSHQSNEVSWHNDNFSNFGSNNLRVKNENYYGMATNDSSSYNSSEGLNHETSSFGESLNLPIAGDNSSFPCSSTNNPPGGNKKKGFKRPLPDDPKEKRRIKRNNRSNKKRNMGMKPSIINKPMLVQMAAKNAPAGVDVKKLNQKKLRMLAGVKLNTTKTKDLNELPKNVLLEMASKHVSEKVNIKAFTKRGLRAFLKQVDPKFKPPETVVPPGSKKCLRRWNAAEKMAAKLIEANTLAQESIVKDEDDTLSNPVKIIETVSMRKDKFEQNKKRKKFVKKERKFTNSSIRSRYNELKTNEVLDYNGLALAGYLRHALFQIFPDKRVHGLILAEYVLDHPNILKLLQYEVRKLLDKKFEKDNNATLKKRALLMSVKIEVLQDDEKYFQDGRAAERSWLMDGCIDILASDVYPSELIPTHSDYMRDTTNIPVHEESIEEYQLLFIIYMYEALGFVITDTLYRKNKIKFHLDNAIIPALLVEFVRSYDTYVEINPFQMFSVKPGDRLALPSAIEDYLARKNNIGYCRNPQSGLLYSELKENRMLVQTKVLDVLPEGAKPSAGLLRNFANLVLFSDEIFSLTRFKLIEHTPYLALKREEKIEMFNAFLKKTYKEAFVIWESKLSIHDMTFKDVSGVPLYIKPKLTA